ncbi:PilW family protein [Amphritea sp.]|uniref:PilW family protein n=1 Tax=Amphritea sp. TaxID=1872502 RepID=UPI0025C0B97A|nr:PilW family protein [Amphritea sp.]
MPAQLLNQRQKGFSLIELMIALVLGLFIVGGVLAVFIGSSASFSSNEALSRVQENGRFALEIIAEDLRNTGNKGSCWGQVTDVINTGDADYEADAYDLNDPIKGWVAAAGEFFVADLNTYNANTDIVLIKHAADTVNATLSANVGSTAASFPIAGGVIPGAILLLSDAAGCDLFQNTAALNSSTLQRGTGGVTIGNETVLSQPLSHSYLGSGSTEISSLSSTLYYVGSGTSTASALRSVNYDNGVAADQELVEGVVDLTLVYAVVSGAGPALDYTNTAADITAANEWDDVVAVRVTVDIEGEQNISHQFTTTVALRNRL